MKKFLKKFWVTIIVAAITLIGGGVGGYALAKSQTPTRPSLSEMRSRFGGTGQGMPSFGTSQSGEAPSTGATTGGTTSSSTASSATGA
ncbi:MAG: hypothetical protein LBI43_05945 [Streptococcaceae bacterium]|jgi:hypothetical protein|nr:hypothetical protein [Streptococcaceae bacterium]